MIWSYPEQSYNSATGRFVWLVRSPGTVSHWTFVRHLHYQRSKHAKDTSVLSFLLHWLTVSRVRAANIVRRPCSDSSHVTAPYKLSSFYYYYYYYYNYYHHYRYHHHHHHHYTVKMMMILTFRHLSGFGARELFSLVASTISRPSGRFSMIANTIFCCRSYRANASAKNGTSDTRTEPQLIDPRMY